MEEINGTIMQYFEWYMESNQNLWNEVAQNAEYLSSIGITAMWLPPAYKGFAGDKEVGYGVYDVYDLGEFDQRGSIKTKYGSKNEYINAIKELEKNQIQSYADIVLNHKMGADMLQTIPATKVDWGDHNLNINNETVRVATKFYFPNRKKKYSDFEWNWTHFTGIDYNDETHENAIFKFKDKEWNGTVDEEFGNFDYLMGADLDFTNEEVREECKKWAKWYVETTGITGFRLDAVKHIPATFYKEWIQYVREATKKELFTVGEYWSGDIGKLHNYITITEGKISLFDVPFHYNLCSASRDENYDLSKIFEGTLVKENPLKAVTFVDNHDTQPGQALESFVEQWFKPAAYALILLRNDGYPCIFYGDFYGIQHNQVEPVKQLEKLIKLRKEKAYGKQNDYIDDKDFIGWTLEGDEKHNQSGLAVVISKAGDGEKRMYIGVKYAGHKFIDVIGNCEEEVFIEDDGWANFKVKARSVSVWIEE